MAYVKTNPLQKGCRYTDGTRILRYWGYSWLDRQHQFFCGESPVSLPLAQAIQLKRV